MCSSSLCHCPCGSTSYDCWNSCVRAPCLSLVSVHSQVQCSHICWWKNCQKLMFRNWSIMYNAPIWVLITTSHDSMSLLKRNWMTPREDNQVAVLVNIASDFIHEVLSSYISQDTGYPAWGFLWFSSVPPGKFKDCSLMQTTVASSNSFPCQS